MPQGVQFFRSVPRWLLVRGLASRWPSVASGALSCIELTELSPPSLPTPEWVRIKTRLSGVCGSDLSAIACKGIVDCTGDVPVVRRMLGTLPVTADGCVIGDGAYVWFVIPGLKGKDDDTLMRIMYRKAAIMDPDAYTDRQACHSTREAAAKGAK